MEFRLTLYNGILLFLMALTGWVVFARSRFNPLSRWFFLYYLVLLLFSAAFPYSLNVYWMAAGVAAAVVIRFAYKRSLVREAGRVLEVVFCGYVLWRGLGLLMLW